MNNIVFNRGLLDEEVMKAVCSYVFSKVDPVANKIIELSSSQMIVTVTC